MFGLNKQQFVLFLILGCIIIALAFFNLKEKPNAIEDDNSFQVVEATSPTTVTQTKNPIEPQKPTVDEVVDEAKDKDITIYITGCVLNPGVYTLKAGSRLADALDLAGGATDEANLLAVNLALIVKDEGMYVLPKQGEAVNAIPQLINETTQNETSKVNINTASQNQLEQLCGIGPVKAEAIIKYREANGCFKETTELTSVTGIGPKTLESIKDEICVK